MSEPLTAAVETIVEGAVSNPDREADLRSVHSIVLKQLAAPGAKSHPNFETWKRQERRLWLLLRAVDARLASRRLDVVDIDEEIARLERRAASK